MSDHEVSEEARQEAARQANQQDRSAQPTQEAARQQTADTNRSETQSATRAQERDQAATATTGGGVQEAVADSAWDEARDQDRGELEVAWDQVGAEAADQLKDAFRGVAEQADKTREALIDQSRQDGGRDVLSDSFAQVDEEMWGARRDVAQARDAGMQGNESAVSEALQSLEARAEKLAELRPDNADRLFTSADIAEAERRLEQGEFQAQGKGLRELRLNIDIDEPQAVANGGAWDEASNKQFLERMTNQVTKSALEEQRDLPDLGSISLREAREQGEQAFREAAFAMLDRRFSEVDELAAITSEARDAMQNLDRDDRTLANALNRSIRDRIEAEATDDARLVAEALRVADIELRRSRDRQA